MKMKKKTIVILLCVLAVISVAVYFCINMIFPKAPPARVPENGIVSVMIDGEEIFEKEKTDILTSLWEAKPTRRMSVNDQPTAERYSKIVIETETEEFFCYLYSEHFTTYMEVPYVGIYKVE